MNYPRIVLHTFILLLTLLTLTSPVTLQAAGFDCAQASQPVERMICADSKLSELDSKLNRKYKETLAELQGADAGRVKAAQKQWIGQRNGCSDPACLTKAYNQRIAALTLRYQQALYVGKDVEVISALEQSYDNAASIVLRFNVPLDRNDNFRQYLEIETEEGKLSADTWMINDDGFLAIYPFIEASTKYTVKVKPGLRAVNGRSHAGNREFSITSRRSEPSASFASNGQVMSSKMRRALPVVTLNIDEVDVDFFHIVPDNIPAWSHYNRSQRRNYHRLKSFSQSNPLVYSARFPIAHQRNQRTTTNLDLSEIPALEKNGAYLAVLRIPGNYKYEYDTNFFTVSDIGIQVRRTEKHMHIFANSIESGEPLADVDISLFANNELKARQSSDQSGTASFSNWFENTETLIARKGDDYTVLRLDRPLDLSGISNATDRYQAMQVFAWGPRDLYRPGERVETYALLRDHDGRAQAAAPLRAVLHSVDGSTVINTILNPTPDGSYHFSYQLSDSVKPGKWKLLYRNPGSNEVLTEYRFSVEDFMPERMALELYDGDPLRHRLFYDQNNLNIPISGKYLYGAPAAGNQIDGLLLAEVDRHPFEQWKGYSFGIDQESISPRRIDLPKTTLDGEGKGQWDIELHRWRTVKSPLALTATASLYESGGRPVTRSFSATRMPEGKLVGIEPQFDERAENDSRAMFKLILTDNQGEAQTGKYHYSLIREDRNYYWTYNDNEGWTWHYDPMEYEAFSGKLEFNGKSPLQIGLPVEWGNYRLEVRDRSSEVVSSYRFRTRWYWWGNSNSGSGLKPDQVNMGFREESHQAGDTAHLLLSPATAGLATITVEDNDQVLWVSQRDVKAEKTEIEIPISDDWSRHDIYVTATILSPGDMKHSVAPKRAFGFINLPLRRADASFDVSIEVPEKVEPLKTVSARIKLDGAITAETYVTVAAVDVGVLNITRFRTPDPVGELFGPRRYEATLYDVYGEIIENAGYDYSRYRFGGGFAQSEAELARGGDKPKNDVQIVSLQSKPVQVDGNGEATVNLDVPQFNGKLRWMVIAWSGASYGSAEANTTVADKLVTQLSKPRFLALGDESELALDISNMSGQTQRLSVTLQTGGALAGSEQVKQLILDDSSKDTLRFPISAVAVGEGSIELQVNNDAGSGPEISLRRDWMLGVRYAYPGIARKEMAVINPGESWNPALEITDLIENSVQGQLILSSQPPIDVNSHFEHLLKYPYGCTEQSTSSGYPWVLVDLDAAQRMQLLPIVKREFKQEYSEAFRREQIEKAVKRVLPRQGSSGGFSLWGGSGGELSWLSVYVTDFLVDAKNAGAEVDASALQKAVNRLSQFLRGRAQVRNRWSSNAEIYRFATRAYAAYVLSRINRVRLSDLRRLYDSAKDRFDDSPLPWAHLAYALDMAGDSQRAQQAYTKATTQEFRERYIGYYDSDLRDLSLTYAILASRGKADSAMLLKIFNLTKERKWLSTQERNALFKAALASKTSTGEKLLALLKTRNFEQNVDQEKPFKTILNFDQVDSIESISGKQSTVYASLEVVGNHKTAPAPYSDGFTIRRDYFDIDGNPIELDSLASGALLVVRLTVTADDYTPDALVVDLLPAGLELENQNLANASVDLSKVAIDGKQLANWRDSAEIAHVGYRDDRFVTALALNRYGSTDVFYLARAVTPGIYRVPPPYIEDMYRPYHHASGETVETLRISR